VGSGGEGQIDYDNCSGIVDSAAGPFDCLIITFWKLTR